MSNREDVRHMMSTLGITYSDGEVVEAPLASLASAIAAAYLEIPDWRRFCHYKNRPQRWIKIHTALLSDDRYLGLTPHQRGVLHGIWLLYAKTDGRVRASPRWLGRQLGFPINPRTLEALNHAGFVRVFASDVLLPERERDSVHGSL